MESSELKIGVLLPGNFGPAGGMGRAAVTLCGWLLGLSTPGGQATQLVLGSALGASDVLSIDPALDLSRVQVTDIRWAVRTEGRGHRFIRPFSLSGYGFLDCDAWILLGCPGDGVLLPLRPFAVFSADWIPRIVPQAIDTFPDAMNPCWASVGDAIQTCRNARYVFATTPHTREDVIDFAGVDPRRALLAPEFTVRNVEPAPEIPVALPFGRYFIWTTNDTPHKNHLRALEMLDLYYRQTPEVALPVVLTGTGVENFDPHQGTENLHPYAVAVRSFIRGRPQLMQNLHFASRLPWGQYRHILENAAFLWHNVIYDNGTASCFEAAQLGVPSLSSDYPQMRFFNAEFGTDISFFSAFDTEMGAAALADMTRATAGGMRAAAPDQVRDASRLKEWFGDLVQRLMAAPTGAADESAPEPLALHLARTYAALGHPLADQVADYVRGFPFASASLVSLSLAEDIDETALVAILAAVLKLLRQDYVSMKLLVLHGIDFSSDGPLVRFLRAEAVHFDILFLGRAIPLAIRGEALRLSRAVVSLGAGGVLIIDSSAVTTIADLAADLRDQLRDSPRTIHEANMDAQLPWRTAGEDDPRLPSVPMPPRRIDFAAEGDNAIYVGAGFFPNQHDYRWIGPAASVTLGQPGPFFSLDLICQDLAFAAAASPPTLTIRIGDELLGTVMLLQGEHVYTLDASRLLRMGSCSEVTIEANFSYKAGGAASPDQRRLSCGVKAIGFVASV